MLKIGYNHVLPEDEDSIEELKQIFQTNDDDYDFAPANLRGLCKINKMWLADKPDLTMEPSPLGLPRKLPENLDLSQALLLIGKTPSFCRLFIFKAGSLYHVRDTPRTYKVRNAFAEIDRKVYFVEEFSRNCSLLDQQCCEVGRLDLNTKDFEQNFSQLNAPKAAPAVFVYKKKIYAMSSEPISPSVEYTPIECLDPLESTWTRLPNPPQDPSLNYLRTYSPYMLDTAKGILLCSTHDDELYEFDLTSRQWNYHSRLPDFYVEVLTNRCSPPPDLMVGCTVGKFLFYYDPELSPEGPVIFVYDVSSTGEHHVLDCMINMSNTFEKYDVSLGSYGYVNHLQGDEFCLAVFYFTSTLPVAKAVCILTFELQRDSVPQSDATAHLPKQRKADKSFFALRPGTLQCRRFQLPMDVMFSFCKKM